MLKSRLRACAEGIEFDPEHHTYFHKAKQKYYKSVSERLRFKDMYRNEAVDNGLIRGTLLHKWTEEYDKGNIQEPSDEIKGYAQAYQSFLLNHPDTNYIGIEVLVASDSWETAGTVDRIIKNKDGSLTVLDIKTGSYNAKHELQIQFYMLMLRAVLRVRKPIKKQLLYLKDTGKYELREVN